MIINHLARLTTELDILFEMQFCIYVAAQVLHREWRRRMLPPLFNQEALEIKRDFELLRRALSMMTEFYPGLRE